MNRNNDWQSMHIAAYKNYIKQRYDEDINIPYHNIYILNKIKDEEQFDNELIHINNIDNIK